MARVICSIPIERQVQIANQAKEVIRTHSGFFEWVRNLSEKELDDPLIDELYDLLEHEPAVGGLFGTSEKKHQEYMARVHEIIDAMLSRTV